VRIAVAYCDFASRKSRTLARAVRTPDDAGQAVPEWAVSEQMNLFRHIYTPLAALFPKRRRQSSA
jgi:hypothetical protein